MPRNEVPLGGEDVLALGPFLEKTRLFRGVDLSGVRPMLEKCFLLEVEPGDAILVRGTRNQNVYVLLGGHMRVHLTHPGEAAQVQVEPGSCCGEMSVIDGEAVSADVIADEPSRLLRIPQDVLWSLVDVSHGTARNLLHVLSARMRHNTALIVQQTEDQRASERAALADALTGLHNRRWLEATFPRQMARSAEDGQPFTVVMVDVDHFKRVNDTWGHVRGDEVLALVGRTLAETVRPGDLLARFGGEEFSLGLPGAFPVEAAAVAERIRHALAQLSIPFRDGAPLPHVTASFGVATARTGESLVDLLARADAALYRSKQSGRNRVTVDEG